MSAIRRSSTNAQRSLNYKPSCKKPCIFFGRTIPFQLFRKFRYTTVRLCKDIGQDKDLASLLAEACGLVVALDSSAANDSRLCVGSVRVCTMRALRNED